MLTDYVFRHLQLTTNNLRVVFMFVWLELVSKEPERVAGFIFAGVHFVLVLFTGIVWKAWDARLYITQRAPMGTNPAPLAAARRLWPTACG